MADVHDERLRELVATLDCPEPHETTSMVLEIRRGRAGDLTDADIESLRWARIFAVKGATKGVNVAETERALKVLDRLIGRRDD
jgi:hypothetical protein